MTYFCPALDPPLDGSGRKTTTLVSDLEYFIHTKFHQNSSSGSGEEVENTNSLTDDGRTDDGRTYAGQRVITIGQWSLWLLCPKTGELPTSLPMGCTWATEWAARELPMGNLPCKLGCPLLPYMETVGSSVGSSVGCPLLQYMATVGSSVGSGVDCPLEFCHAN